MKEITKEWIDKAEKDFKVCLRESTSIEPLWDEICFHSQQCIEKYLKSVLQENNIFFQKTHDLGILANQTKKFFLFSDDLLEKLEIVSQYAVEIRYPGIEVTEKEAKESFETCKEIRKLVRNYFGLEVWNE